MSDWEQEHLQASQFTGQQGMPPRANLACLGEVGTQLPGAALWGECLSTLPGAKLTPSAPTRGQFSKVSSRSCLHTYINMKQAARRKMRKKGRKGKRERERQGRRERKWEGKVLDSTMNQTERRKIRCLSTPSGPCKGLWLWWMICAWKSPFICLLNSVKVNCAKFQINWKNTPSGLVNRTWHTKLPCAVA